MTSVARHTFSRDRVSVTAGDAQFLPSGHRCHLPPSGGFNIALKAALPVGESDLIVGLVVDRERAQPAPGPRPPAPPGSTLAPGTAGMPLEMMDEVVRESLKRPEFAEWRGLVDDED